MRLPSVVPSLLLSLVVAVVPLAAEDGFTPGATAPQTTTVAASDAYDAVVRIADTPWVERELSRFAAALGRDPQPLRRALAEGPFGPMLAGNPEGLIAQLRPPIRIGLDHFVHRTPPAPTVQAHPACTGPGHAPNLKPCRPTAKAAHGGMMCRHKCPI